MTDDISKTKKSKPVKGKSGKTGSVKPAAKKSEKKVDTKKTAGKKPEAKKPEKAKSRNVVKKIPKSPENKPKKAASIKQEVKSISEKPFEPDMSSVQKPKTGAAHSRIQKILASRAKELSELSAEDQISSDTIEVVEFVLAYEQYGIESGYIREVFSMKEYTQIPGTPPFVLGVVNVRGQILSVVDIKKFFGLPTGGLSDLNRVVICSYEDMEVGILADIIKGVRIIRIDDIQNSLPTINDARAEYIKGVTDEGLVILDIEKLLSQSRLIVNDEVEA